MKNWCLILGALFLTLFTPTSHLNAQVTIGSDVKPIEGALLDLKEKAPTNPLTDNVTAFKGLMLPRVNLLETDQLYPMFEAGSSPTKYKFGTQELVKTDEDAVHTGLTVYNMTDNCLFCPGVYSWDGAIWMRVMDPCCPCLFSITSGGKLHQSVYLGVTPSLGGVTANYYDGGTHATTYQWYSHTSKLNTGGVALTGSTSDSYTLTAAEVSTTGTYYFYCVATNTCNGKTMASDVYSVEVTDPCASNAVVSSTGANVCGSGIMTLTATASPGAIIRWYDQATGGTLLQTGTSATDTYTTGNLTSTTVYWVEAYNATYNCTSARQAVIATVNEIPAAPTGTGLTICPNTAATLSATPPSGCTIDWYDMPTGGTRVGNGTTSYTTPVLSAAKTYYAEARNILTGCTSTSRRAITASVRLLPAITGSTTGTTPSLNGTSTVPVNATPNTGSTIRWYDSNSGGTLLYTGSTYYAPVDCTTKYVYAEAYNSCGVSTRTQYTIPGFQTKISGTLKITRSSSSSLFDQVYIILDDINLPPAAWVTLQEGQFSWPTGFTAGTYPNTFNGEVKMSGSPGAYAWRVRAYTAYGCGMQIECEGVGSYRNYEIRITIGGRTVATGTYNSSYAGATTTINFSN